jgi:trigger factor
LKVTREKIENRQAYLTVEVEPAEMEAAKQDSYRRLAQRADIPGFRKGKAPRAVVERHLGKDRLLEEAVEHLLPQAYEQAVKEGEVEPYARPEVEITQNDPLVFKAVVPLAPTVALGDYQAVRMEAEKVDITEERINKVLEELRHQHATWEPVERALTYDDLAVIDIDSYVGEKPLIKRIGFQYQVQRDAITPAPGFVEQIVGMKKDEEKEFRLTFPADYPGAPEVAGKEASFKVKLTEIKEEKLPPLDDTLAVQVSPEFKTLKRLREEVVKSLTLRGEENARMEFEERVINAVIDQSQVEYPPVLVALETERILSEQARQLQAAGRGMDDYLRSINKTPEQLQEELKPVASKNVAASLVLSKVAEAENIEVTEEDITNGIRNMARGAPEEQWEEMVKMLDTPQARQSLTQSIKVRKTIERLTQIAAGGPAKKTRKETGAKTPKAKAAKPRKATKQETKEEEK